jgi:hypothetical protein
MENENRLLCAVNENGVFCAATNNNVLCALSTATNRTETCVQKNWPGGFEIPDEEKQFLNAFFTCREDKFER